MSPGAPGRLRRPVARPGRRHPRRRRLRRRGGARSAGVTPRRAAAAGLTVERLARLRPAFRPAADGGTVTAGNSCGVNDGAAAVAARGRRRRTAGSVCPGCGCWPRPPPASTRTSRASAWCPPPSRRSTAPASGSTTSTWSSSTRPSPGRCWPAATRCRLDPDRVCVEGGALALGHPWGASGAVLVVRLFSQLVRAGRGPLRAGGDRGRRRPGRRDGGRAMPVIEARGRHPPVRRTRRRTVLADVDVRLTEQRVGVVGANGSGKSTFARMLNGLVLPDRGHGDASTGSTPAARAARCAAGSASASPTRTRRS